MCCASGTCENCKPKAEQVRKNETHDVTYDVPLSLVRKFLENMEPGTSLDGYSFSETFVYSGRVMRFSLSKDSEKVL